MQVLLVLVPAQRLLLYLVDLVDPEAVVCLPVAVLLSPLPLGHIDFPCRLRVLRVHLGWWDRLNDAVPFLLSTRPLGVKSLVVAVDRLLVCDVTHLAHQVI